MTDATVTGANRPAPAPQEARARRMGLHWRSSFTHAATPELVASSLFNAQTWIDRSLWRPAALWAGLAGAITAGVLPQHVDWRELTLALLLVDVLWGSVWRLAGGRQSLLPLAPRMLRRHVWLPYLQPGSPAARVFSDDHEELWPLAFRIGVPAVLLVLLVAAVLGIPALVLSLLLITITLLGWTVRHTLDGIPVMLYSLAAVGLPWLLVWFQLAPDQDAWLPPFLLAGLWTLHHWGETRIRSDVRDGIGMVLLGGAEVALCALLIFAQAPLWLAGLVLLFLPGWLAIVQEHTVGQMQPLWLIAMLVSAIAIAQS